MKVTEKIIELTQGDGVVRAKDLYDFGYTRTHIERGLADLVARKKIYRRGHAKATYYTSDPLAPDVPVVHPGQRSRSYQPELPDLPDNLLLMMGYTKLPVNEFHARNVGGW